MKQRILRKLTPENLGLGEAGSRAERRRKMSLEGSEYLAEKGARKERNEKRREEKETKKEKREKLLLKSL